MEYRLVGMWVEVKSRLRNLFFFTNNENSGTRTCLRILGFQLKLRLLFYDDSRLDFWSHARVVN